MNRRIGFAYSPLPWSTLIHPGANMKTLVAASVCLFARAALAVRADEPKKDTFDPAKLVGKWKYASSVKGGESAPAERLMGDVDITKDTFTIPGGPDMKFVMAYKLDT